MNLPSTSVTSASAAICHVFVVAQRSGDTAYPKLHLFLDRIRHMTPDNNIGDGKAPARFEHPKRFLEHAVFIAGKVNDAVPDDDIHRVLRKGDVLDFAFKELDIGKAAFALIFFCE